MSDTAKELRQRIDEAFERGDRSPIMRAEMLDRCLARIEQLERGIEKANVDAAPDGDGGWFSIHDLDKYGEFVAGKTPSASLKQLIEELGQGAD